MPISDRGVFRDVPLEQNRAIVGTWSLLLHGRLDKFNERERRDFCLGEKAGRHDDQKSCAASARETRQSD